MQHASDVILRNSETRTTSIGGGETLIIPSVSKIPKNRAGMCVLVNFWLKLLKKVEIVTQGPDTNTTHTERYANQNFPCPSPQRYFARDGHAESTQEKERLHSVVCFVMNEEEL